MGIIYTRNNGKYIVLLATLLLFFYYRRSIAKKIAYELVIIVCAIIFENALMNTYNHKQLFKEAVGIPIQQISAVIASDGNYSKEDADFISELLPLDTIREKYDPSTSDPIKWDGNFNSLYLESHKAEFIGLWFKLGGFLIDKTHLFYGESYE